MISFQGQITDNSKVVSWCSLFWFHHSTVSISRACARRNTACLLCHLNILCSLSFIFTAHLLSFRFLFVKNSKCTDLTFYTSRTRLSGFVFICCFLYIRWEADWPEKSEWEAIHWKNTNEMEWSNQTFHRKTSLGFLKR